MLAASILWAARLKKGNLPRTQRIDLYDLMTLEETNAKVTFIYDNEEYLIDIFPDQGEVVYQFGSRWFHGADDFLEKARVNQKRLTTVYHQIRDIKVRK